MKRARRLTPREISTALRAAAHTCRHSMVHVYAGGQRTIKYREPTDSSYHFATFRSTDFAAAAGCGTEVALAHLVRLASEGRVIEKHRSRSRAVRRFRLPRAEYDALAREIIVGLEKLGLPHNDEWQAARSYVGASK